MTNFEKITASPEVLGEFLAALPVATGPWDESFHRKFCDTCERDKRENCGTPVCPKEKERNNPLWWLTQAAEGEQVALAAPCGDTKRQKVECGVADRGRSEKGPPQRGD